MPQSDESRIDHPNVAAYSDPEAVATYRENAVMDGLFVHEAEVIETYFDVEVGDATDRRFDDDAFDHVLFSYYGIDYVHPESERRRALREGGAFLRGPAPGDTERRGARVRRVPPPRHPGRSARSGPRPPERSMPVAFSSGSRL